MSTINKKHNRNSEAGDAKKRIETISKAEERKKNVVNSYVEKLKKTDKQKIDLKIKDLKELEEQIKEEIIFQEKKRAEYVDDIFANGESLVKEIEEKRVKEQTKKSIFKRVIDFLFGF